MLTYNNIEAEFKKGNAMSYVEIKVREIGNSKGVILPAEVMARLRVDVGDTLYATETPGGIKISSYDPKVAKQIETAMELMDEDRDVLAALAKL